MKSPKETAKSLVEHMADDISWGDLANKLILLAKIAEAEQDITEGKGIPHEEVMREFDQWVESSGLQPQKRIRKTTTKELQKTR